MVTIYTPISIVIVIMYTSIYNGMVIIYTPISIVMVIMYTSFIMAWPSPALLIGTSKLGSASAPCSSAHYTSRALVSII